MSHLMGWKYAYFRHKNAHNIKGVQHTSKKQTKNIFIVLCIHAITTKIANKQQQQKDKNCTNQSLMIVYPPPPPKKKKVNPG